MLKPLLASLALAAATASPLTTVDDPPAAIDRVEEDWEIVVTTTDADAVGPQMTTTMCPGASSDCPTVNFNLNYREKPNFRGGGLQVQAWNGGTLLSYASSKSAQLATDGETVSWTQRMKLEGGEVRFEVVSGASTTWGSFGDDELSVRFDLGIDDLSGYTPEASVAKSGVGWQSDHVTSMKLLRVRYYSGDTLVATDDTARSVDSDE